MKTEKLNDSEYYPVVEGPFFKCSIYNANGDVVLSQWLDQPPHLDNGTQKLDCMPFPQGVEDEMAPKINRSVTIDGKKRWIRANSEQEYADKLMKLSSPGPQQSEKHPFKEYALSWFETYSKPSVEKVTSITYERQLKRYLLPAFDRMSIEDITAGDIQRLFNGMDTAKATKDKAKIVLNQILDSAVDDGYIPKNPLKSKKIRIVGTASKTTDTYSVEQMQYLVRHIADVKQPQDRAYLAIQALHPLRLEEVLGLKWGDIDLENLEIHICRAVTHPDRNQPEIKSPKTASSVRPIGLAPIAAQYLIPGNPEEFVFGGKQPLSYTQVRRMCNRIKADTGFSEKITPIRFRTTVLTDLYSGTKDIKLAQAAAGHSTSAMTLKYYVKGRETVTATGAIVEKIYSV